MHIPEVKGNQMIDSITPAEIEELVERVGDRLVVFVAHSDVQPGIDLVSEWTSGEKAPAPLEARRLMTALTCLREVAAAEKSTATAYVWFIGSSVGDAGVSPAEAIRSDDLAGAIASSQRMINDVWS